LVRLCLAFDFLLPARTPPARFAQEQLDTKHPQLQYEYKVYRALAHCEGIPRVRWSGTSGEGKEQVNIVVMDLLGDSLENMFTKCGRKFSLKTVIMIGMQLVRTHRRLLFRPYCF
jgi:hypothetical protein